jgi:putative peptide zinc metalloprotease protein
VPQNISAAVNYACVECVTYALATQLVVSTPGPLSDGGMARLAQVWEELRAFGEQIDGVPLAELRDRLTEYEQRILDVVRADTAPADGSGAADPTGQDAMDSSGAADPTTGTSTTGSPASDPTGEPATGTEDGGAATADPAQPTEAEPTGSTAATTTAAPASSSASGSGADGAPVSSAGSSG